MRHEKATTFGGRVQEHCVWRVRSNTLARDAGRKGKNEEKDHIRLGVPVACVMRGVEYTDDNFS